MITTKGSVLRVAKASAAIADLARPSRPGVVVLLYHRVAAGSTLEVDLPAGLFDEQMATLATGRRATSLDDALLALRTRTGSDPPEVDPIVVTFDDGTADLADRALPILVRHGVPATVYVATDFIETGRPFPNDGTPLSWAALRDMASTGLITVGSHTHTHALLDRLPADAVAAELDRSIGLIQDRLGIDAHHFAYPKGLVATGAVEAVVRQRFRSAAVGGTAKNRYGHTDPHRLARSAIQVSDGMRWFRRKLDGGMALEDTLRRALNRRRYAGATT